MTRHASCRTRNGWRTGVTLALAAGLGTGVAGLAAVAPAPARASDDVITVYDDGLVYAGGFYDIEVKPSGFTPVEVRWRAKLYAGFKTRMVDLSDYTEDPNYWVHGAKTLHLSWGTVCDSWLKDGSDDGDFGLLRMECLIKDERGSWHDSEDFMIRVRSLGAFRERMDSDGGVELSDVTPAPSGSLTTLQMKLGETIPFRVVSDPVLPGWVQASEPRWERRIEVLEGGKTMEEGLTRYEGGTLDFKPPREGEYLVCLSSDLYLGNVTYSGVSGTKYYRVIVNAAEEPAPAPVSTSMTGTVIRYLGSYDGSPEPGEAIPPSQVNPTVATQSMATLTGSWQVLEGTSWKKAGLTFEAGKSYRFVVEATPKGDRVFQPDDRRADVTRLVNCRVLTNGSWALNQTFSPAPGSLATHLLFVTTRVSVPAAPVPAGPGVDDFELEPVEGGEEPDPGFTGWEEFPEGWRYFEAGVRVESAWRLIGGVWYWFGADGLMATGWLQLGGTWYWFEDSGAMATGWRHIGGAWYWFEDGGAMAIGWRSIGGVWYWFEDSGAMATGWRHIGGAWYYFDASGAMLHDAWVGSYHLASDGHWDNG